jgi:hypothetical protein
MRVLNIAPQYQRSIRVLGDAAIVELAGPAASRRRVIAAIRRRAQREAGSLMWGRALVS